MDFKYINNNIFERLTPEMVNNLNNINFKITNMPHKTGIKQLTDSNDVNSIRVGGNIANNYFAFGDKERVLYVPENPSDLDLARMIEIKRGNLENKDFLIHYSNDELFNMNIIGNAYSEKIDYINDRFSSLGYRYDLIKNELFYEEKSLGVISDRFKTLILDNENLELITNKEMLKDFLDNIALNKLEDSLNELEPVGKFKIRNLGFGMNSLDYELNGEINTLGVYKRENLFSVLKTLDFEKAQNKLISDSPESLFLYNVSKDEKITQEAIKLLEDFKDKDVSEKYLEFIKKPKYGVALAGLFIAGKILSSLTLTEKEKDFVNSYIKTKGNVPLSTIDSFTLRESQSEKEYNEMATLLRIEKEFTNTEGFDNEIFAKSLLYSKVGLNSKLLGRIEAMLDKEYEKDMLKEDLKELKLLENELKEEELREKEVIEKIIKEQEKDYKEYLENLREEKENTELEKKSKQQFKKNMIALTLLLPAIFGKNKKKEEEDKDEESSTFITRINLIKQLEEYIKTNQNNFMNQFNRSMADEAIEIREKKVLDTMKLQQLSFIKNTLTDAISKIKSEKAINGLVVGDTLNLELNTNKIDVINDSMINLKEISTKGFEINDNKIILNPISNSGKEYNNYMKETYENYTIIDNISSNPDIAKAKQIVDNETIKIEHEKEEKVLEDKEIKKAKTSQVLKIK